MGLKKSVDNSRTGMKNKKPVETMTKTKRGKPFFVENPVWKIKAGKHDDSNGNEKWHQLKKWWSA